MDVLQNKINDVVTILKNNNENWILILLEMINKSRIGIFLLFALWIEIDIQNVVNALSIMLILFSFIILDRFLDDLFNKKKSSIEEK